MSNITTRIIPRMNANTVTSPIMKFDIPEHLKAENSKCVLFEPSELLQVGLRNVVFEDSE